MLYSIEPDSGSIKTAAAVVNVVSSAWGSTAAAVVLLASFADTAGVCNRAQILVVEVEMARPRVGNGCRILFKRSSEQVVTRLEKLIINLGMTHCFCSWNYCTAVP